jgi:hypothetical protein
VQLLTRAISKYVGLIIFVTLFSTTAAFIPNTFSEQSSSTAQTALVVGNKQKYLWGESNYTFVHNSTITFEAPTLAGWAFDHMDIDFGCEVVQITGSNVTKVFTITNGSIAYCRPG